jgi:predicted metal-binding protein
MTVRTLIECLEKCDPDIVVVVNDQELLEYVEEVDESDYGPAVLLWSRSYFAESSS